MARPDLKIEVGVQWKGFLSEQKEPITWHEAQKILVIDALNRTNGNKTKAARALGVSLRTLRNKVVEFDLGDWKLPKPVQLSGLTEMPLEKDGCP